MMTNPPHYCSLILLPSSVKHVGIAYLLGAAGSVMGAALAFWHSQAVHTLPRETARKVMYDSHTLSYHHISITSLNCDELPSLPLMTSGDGGSGSDLCRRHGELLSGRIDGIVIARDP